MRKTLAVAWREFWATVGTKGFIIAIFLPIVLMTGALALMPILMNKAAPQVTGEVAVIDRSGAVAPKLEVAFSAEEIKRRLDERIEQQIKQAAEKGLVSEAQREEIQRQAQAMMKGPDLQVRTLPNESDIDEAKRPLSDADGKSRGDNRRLALAVIPAEAVRAEEGKPYGSYELFIAPKLDPEVQDDLRDEIGRNVVDARLEAAGLDAKKIRGMTERARAETRVVTREGEQKANNAAAFLLPIGFLMLLWISVFSGGQGLLTSTVEEKGSRIMEVLLSAVSPMELMVGKILGQMGVALLLLGAYAALGVGGLVTFRQMHLIEPMLLVYLVIYFVIAFFLVASLMAAIGSAVNDIREAQALMGPVMIVLIIPMMLWLPISRNPNSMFAQICSFIPPINPFIMVIRLAGSEKIPAWQIPASMAIGIVAAVIAAWAAAKIFRIGVLMYGKPPNFTTLLKWIRMA